MPGKSKLSVNAAVMNCISRCSESDAPLACLGEFLDELSSLGWDYADIRNVATTVIGLLSARRAMSDDRYQGAALSEQWASN
jgi:hypothetical protein